MKKETGGPAFPLPAEQCIHTESQGIIGTEGYGRHAEYGMTLRDYFAAGFASAQTTATSDDTGFIVPDYIYPDGQESVAQKIARISYVMADAMLAARSV